MDVQGDVLFTFPAAEVTLTLLYTCFLVILVNYKLIILAARCFG